MTYIIYKKTGQFPKAWEKVTTIKHIFPGNGWLNETYGLKDDDIIKINYTKRSKSKYKWKVYRTAFKHIFHGTVAEFKKFSHDHCKKRRNKK